MERKTVGEPRGRDETQADLAFAGVILLLVLLWVLLYLSFPLVGGVLFFGAILAYALLPVIDFFGRRGYPRTLAIALVALVGVGIAVTVAVLLAPSIASQFEELPGTLRETTTDLRDTARKLRSGLPDSLGRQIDRAEDWLAGSWSRLVPTDRMGDWAGSVARTVTNIATGLIFVPIFVFLILKGYHPAVRGVASLIPPRWRAQFSRRSRQADDVLAGFIRGQLLVATIIAALYAIGFSLVGIPLGLVVGLLAGFGELIPYLGGAIALILASLLAIAGGQPLDVLWVLAIFALVQTLEGAFISPWIVGRKAELRPGVVILALVVGGELLGVVGMLAAIPVAALFKVAASAVADAWRGSNYYLRRRATV